MVLIKPRAANIQKYSRNVLIAAMVIVFCFLSACGTGRNMEMDRQYQRLVEKQQAKREAIEAPDVQKKPAASDPEGFEEMGDSYLRMGKMPLAQVEYEKALKADPNRAQVRQKLAYVLLKQQMWLKALDEFDIILEKSPGDPGSMQGKATALMNLNRLTEARKVLESLINNDSSLWQAHALLGTVYDRQRMYTLSRDEYEKALAINPNAAGLHEKLGRSLYMVGDYKQSAAVLLKAIDQNGPSANIYTGLGFALFKLGLIDEAYETFRKGGDEATACNNMGKMYLEAKDFRKSIEYFEKAIDLKPSYYEAANHGLKKARAALDNSARSPAAPVKDGARGK